MSLQEKSDEEISDLLDQYGIRHGPIVASTRGLYEKKVEEAMEDAPQQPSSDKTYYREEVEEVTYITYSPARQEGHADLVKRKGNTEQDEPEGSDQDAEPPVQASRTSANHSSAPLKQPVKKSGGCLWRATRLLLILALLAAVFYYVYCHLLQREDNALDIQ